MGEASISSKIICNRPIFNLLCRLELTLIRLVYPYFNKAGGVERYVVELAHALDQKNHQIEIVCSEYDQNIIGSLNVKKIFQCKLGAVLRLISFLLSDAVTSRPPDSLTHTQGTNSVRADIVHAQSCHKAWFLESLKQLKPFSWTWIRKLINPIHYAVIVIETIQYSWRRPRAIIAISQIVKEQIIDYFNTPDELIHVIYSGVNCEEFTPSNNETRQQSRKSYGLTNDQIVLCFAGHEFRRKNLKTVIEALSLIEDDRYILLVAGKDDTSSFEKIAKDNGVGDRVRFLGAVTDLANLFRASDVFVFPTSHDAFGLVITEAMAAGLPVITGPDAGAAELIESGKNGIVMQNIYDATELTNHIKSLSHQQFSSSLSKAARKTAEEHTWCVVGDQISNLYSKLQQSKPPTRPAPPTTS